MHSDESTGQKSLDVAYVTQVDLTGTSGQNLYSREVATALANHDRVRLILICPAPSGDRVAIFDRSDVTVRPIPTKTPGSIAWHGRIQFSTAKALYGAHRERDLDGVVTTLKSSNIVPPVFSSLYCIPLIVLVEGMLVKNIAQQRPFPGAAQLAQLISLANGSSARHVFTAYEEAQTWVRDLPGVKPENVTVFHHGVDTELFKPIDKTSARIQLSLDIKSADLVVGFVGSFKPYHCLAELVRSVHTLRKCGKDVKLVLVGDGEEREPIGKLISELDLEDSVTFTGFVDHDAVSRYISACDVLYGVIDPDHWGYPMKVHEYLACGRPVIAYDDEELRFIEKEELGVLVSTVSSDAITDALITFLEKAPSERHEMEQAARRYILAEQTWDTYANRIVEQIIG